MKSLDNDKAAENTAAKEISPQEFCNLNWDEITILDLRELHTITEGEFPGSINMPFAKIFTEIDNIPRDKPVYSICQLGDWSAEVTEILSLRGYEAYNLKGGYAKYRSYVDDRITE